MGKQRFFCLMGIILFAALLAGLAAPLSAQAAGHAAPTPTATPLPLLPAKVGSNAHIAMGALVLVLIIFLGVAINIRRKK